MDRTLYAVANDKNFVNTVFAKDNQSEFFYYKRELGGLFLTPNDTFLKNIEGFFDGDSLCKREHEAFERFVKYADYHTDDVFSRVLDEHLATIGV